MTTLSRVPDVRIRPVQPEDREVLGRFYADLSPDSREARFLGATPGIGDGTARFFCGPDHEHREGLVAVAGMSATDPIIVGHLCLEPPDDDPGATVEMAVAVADAWQHLGIGRALLAEAIRWAEEHHVACLTASMRWSNASVVGLIRSSDRPVSLGASDGGVVDARIRLGVTVPEAA